jgi:hypothetical protein
MFEAILSDERRHERYTRELLVELSGGERPARAALRRAVAGEAWRTWRRAGRFVAQRIYGALMLLLYLSLAPFALCLAALRPARRGWRAMTSDAPPAAPPLERVEAPAPAAR